MPALSPFAIVFVLFNAVFGVIIGVLTARVPSFGALGIPSFLWLVAGMFAFEMAAGFALNAHPSSLITMPARWRNRAGLHQLLCDAVTHDVS